MGAILRKLRCDLRSNRLQRLSIVLLLALATAALTTSLTVQARGGTAWDELYREANGAHAWFYGNEAFLAGIQGRPEIQQTAGPYEMTRADVAGAEGPMKRPYPLWLQAVGTTQPEIDRPVVVSGRWIEADGEVVLGRKFAKDNGYGPGDSIVLRTANGTKELTVSGLAVFAGRSPFSLPALAWTTEGTLTGALEPNFGGLGIQLESRGEVRAFRDALQLEPGGSEFYLVEDWNGVRAQNDEATQVIATFLGIFSVFALISAAFVIVNAISGRILARYRDIGLMKAIGFTPRQLMAGLLIEQCGMALVAAVAGTALGALLVPALDDPASREFATESLGYFRPGLAVAIGAGVVGLVAAATMFPAWRAGRIPTVQAIRFGPGRTEARPSRLAGFASALRLPAWAVIGAKDTFDRPVRAWLTVGALTLSVVTMTFVFTSEWSIRQLMERPELIGEPFELVVESDNPAAIEAAIKADPEVDAYFEWGKLSVTVEGKEEEVNLAALGPGYDQVDWVVSRGRLFSAPGEATVGKGFLDLMDAELGDTVRLVVQGKTVSLKLVGMYRATEDGGRWALTSVETARQQVDPSLVVSGFAVALKDGADSDAAEERYRVAGSRSTEVFDHSADGIGAVRAVLGGLGAMLLLVGLVSLVNTVSLGVRERQRDLGILKAIGLTPRQVVGSVLASAAILTAVALVIGIPFGMWVSKTISDLMGNNLGWGPGLFETAPATWIAAIVPVTLVAVLGAALIPAALAARTRPSDVLRNE